MRRREFIAIVGGAAAWPLEARAQNLANVPRSGFLLHLDPVPSTEVDAFRQGLRDLGEHRQTVVDLAAKSRITTMWGHRQFVDAGGLMAYALNWYTSYDAPRPTWP